MRFSVSKAVAYGVTMFVALLIGLSISGGGRPVSFWPGRRPAR